jgi:deoxycitidine kinase/deoxyguanosine kinase
MKTYIFTVEGNIGAGKTTFLERLQREWPEATVVLEPVGTWMTMKEKDGTSLLDHFYADKKRWSYTFQTAAFLTRLMDTERVLEAVQKTEGPPTEGPPTEGPRVVITERSVLTDRYVFAEMLHDSGDMSDLEYDLYLRWYNRFATHIPIKGILHLTTDPTISLERIGIRGREAETSIQKEYLEALDSQHRRWLATTTLPVFTISCVDSLKKWIQEQIS